MSDFTRSPELEGVVRRWLYSYADGDRETVLNLLSTDDAMGYIGSAQDEHWRGPEVRHVMDGYLDDIPRFGWTATEFHGFERGALGWVEFCGEATALDQNAKASFRSTFVLALKKGVWRIVHVHNSNPVSNMVALGYEARGFEELLDAALSIPRDLAQTGLATIMFTDIADSTTIAAAIGDTRWTRSVNAHVRQVRQIIEDHGGTLVKSLGDGTMSTFTSARAALVAAGTLQRSMAEAREEPQLQIRIGLHTGDLVEQDEDMFGTVVNKAARIAATAGADEIHVSDATRIMVGGAESFRFGPPVSTRLKGLDGDHVFHRLDWWS